MTTTPIRIPFPEASARHLKVSVGACRLSVSPTDEPDWVTGVYIDPIGFLPIKIDRDGGEVRLSQEFNPIETSGGFQGLATLELRLGKSKPYWLSIEGGANEANVDLGGLPILRLFVRHAAGKYSLDFREPNPQPLSLFHLAVGIGAIEIKNLANANLVEMVVEGGAAACSLEFGGQLRRDAEVRIAMGLSSVEVVLPAALPARITSDTVLASLESDERLVREDGELWTLPAVVGRRPVLTLRTASAMGSTKLRLIGESKE